MSAGVGPDSVHYVEYLVKWRGLEYGDSTWERADDLAAEEAVSLHMQGSTRLVSA